MQALYPYNDRSYAAATHQPISPAQRALAAALAAHLRELLAAVEGSVSGDDVTREAARQTLQRHSYRDHATRHRRLEPIELERVHDSGMYDVSLLADAELEGSVR